MTASEQGKLDRALVASLYEEHARELQRFVLGVLGDASAMADVMQATFAKAIEKGCGVAEKSRKAWLFRVALNEAMAIRRRQGVAKRSLRALAEQAGLLGQEHSGSQADRQAIRHETIDRVRQALEELPQEQARVVRLRMYQEKTFAAIAEELQIPLGTALNRMHAALKKLRIALQGEQEG